MDNNKEHQKQCNAQTTRFLLVHRDNYKSTVDFASDRQGENDNEKPAAIGRTTTTMLWCAKKSAQRWSISLDWGHFIVWMLLGTDPWTTALSWKPHSHRLVWFLHSQHLLNVWLKASQSDSNQASHSSSSAHRRSAASQRPSVFPSRHSNK